MSVRQELEAQAALLGLKPPPVRLADPKLERRRRELEVEEVRGLLERIQPGDL